MAVQKEQSTYDYIIAGCGGAGLSLAYYLSQSKILNHKRVLLLDAEEKNSNDRSWCFWAKDSPIKAFVPQRKWKYLQLSEGNGVRKHSIAPFHYYYTAGKDFYREIKSILKQHQNFSFEQVSVKKIENCEKGVRVVTNEKTYEGHWAFSSLPASIPDTSLVTKQRFRGWFIRTSAAEFEQKAVRLMDFRTTQKNGAAFFYLLPFTAHEALVEYTVISNQALAVADYEQELKRYIDQELQIKNFEITQTEQGVIPMTNYHFPRQRGEHIMYIGTRGGMTKATTGFTFKNMLNDARHIVRNLESKGHPFYEKRVPTRFRFYDTLLLQILKFYPKEGKYIFENLFEKNSTAKILRFLDEKTSLWEEATMFMKLPWKPFLRALWQYYIAPSRRDKMSWKHIKAPYYATEQSQKAQ
ncbi:lycopene cyclase family protein [Catalinimonas sp. 4WD22]|uniref:lycopene cyclase family protein n=1 Tax=Catalinimonas locisalis TaxID=3133978 RepID=UPI00310188EE